MVDIRPIFQTAGKYDCKKHALYMYERGLARESMFKAIMTGRILSGPGALNNFISAKAEDTSVGVIFSKLKSSSDQRMCSTCALCSLPINTLP